MMSVFQITDSLDDLSFIFPTSATEIKVKGGGGGGGYLLALCRASDYNKKILHFSLLLLLTVSYSSHSCLILSFLEPALVQNHSSSCIAFRTFAAS